jgi:plastocyanin
MEYAGGIQDAVKPLAIGLLLIAALPPAVIPRERSDRWTLPRAVPGRSHEHALSRSLGRLGVTAAVPYQSADTTITIRASGSTLEYDPPRISVKNGRRVRLRFVNEGTLPHNLVLPRSEDDLDGLILAAYESSETGYIPVAQKDKLLGYTTLASPGETVEIAFTVPPPGEYKYVCLFPGHANSMLGTLRSLK